MLFKMVRTGIERHELKKFYDKNPDGNLYDQNKINEQATYFIVYEDSKVVAATSFIKITHNVAMTQKTLVARAHRGEGIAKYMNDQVEKFLKSQGFNKITSHIYTDNLPSVILKLKRGYLIEGLLKDHDEMGRHEYILSKMIGD